MVNLKTEAFDAFCSVLESEIQDVERNRAASQQDANEASHAMESRYDTFREDAQALEAAFRIKLEKKKTLLGLIESIRGQCTKTTEFVVSGALVTLVDGDDNEVNYYVIPGGEGKELTVHGKKYKCISPGTPVGKRMLGKKDGETVQGMGRSRKSFEVVSVE